MPIYHSPGYYIEVSVSLNPKSRYKLYCSFGLSDESRAHAMYHGINIGRGYKKRLVMKDFVDKITVIRRDKSCE